MLPADGHVHTEWSWDTTPAPGGVSAASMERTCARAVELGLPSVAFTEHADFAPLALGGPAPPEWRHWVDAAGHLAMPPLDVAGYLAEVARCRELFPALRIRSGAELSEPHRYPGPVAALIASAGFDQVLGSVHTLRPAPGVARTVMPPDSAAAPAADLREYLAEVERLAASDAPFEVLAHVDYAVRYWRGGRAAPYRVADFESEYRAVLRALAGSSRVLEVNTRLPLDAEIVRWWRDCGGQAVSFGSDAHTPDALARRFGEVAAMVEACGFRASAPHDFWARG